MADKSEIASRLYGTRRAEGSNRAMSTEYAYGTAVEDSDSGTVRVIPDGIVTGPDDGQAGIILNTSPSVEAGDRVLVMASGGMAKAPWVVASSGEGDRQNALIKIAQLAAEEAKEAVDGAVDDIDAIEQDIADFKSGADVDYAIYTYVDDEIGEFSQTVSATYLSKTDAQTTYATQSQLTQTAEGITASVAQTYATKYEAADGNLIEESALVDGYILNTGELSPSDAAKEWTTEFIAVTPGQALSYSVYLDETPTRSWRMWIAYCFYDSQQAMVGSRVAKYGTTDVDLELSYPSITVPEGAAYIRCSWRYYDATSHAVLVRDADATYATKSELTVGLDGITSEVSQTYATKTEAATTGSGSSESVDVADGAGLRILTVYGKSIQDGTPTPSAPAPIQSVGGANLADESTLEVGYFASSSAFNLRAEDAHKERATGYIAVDAGTFVTIQIWVDDTEGWTTWQPWIGFYFYNADKSAAVGSRYTKTATAGETYIENTVQVPEGASFLRVSFRYYGGSRVQVNAGSTALPYIPYGSLGLKVSGKNRLDKAEISAGTNVSVTQLETGVQVSATNSQTYRMAHVLFSSLGLVNGNSYTISAHAHVNAGQAKIVIRNSGSSDIASTATQSSDATMSLTFTYDSSTMYELCFFCTWGTAALGDIEYTDIILNEGSTATDYEPYMDSLTEIPLAGHVLASLPDGTKDVLSVDASGHCVITKNVAYTLYDGDSSEDWRAVSGNTSYYIRDANIKYTGGNNNPNNVQAMTDRYPFAGSYNSGSSVNDAFTVGGSGSITNVAFKVVSTYAALTDWTAALAANPLRIVYPLAEPVIVDLGYITMPELSDGCTVGIIASLTPTIDAGWYTGNGSAIYEQSTRITQTEQDVTTAITGVEGLQTMVRQYDSGVLVCRTGNSVGALVNADGSFDVVSVTWNGDTPSAGDVLGRFEGKNVYLGVEPTGPADGANLATMVSMNGGLFTIQSSLIEPETTGDTDYTAALTIMRALSDLLDNWQMTVGDKAFLTMSEFNYGYQSVLRVDGKTQPLVAGVDATSSKTDNTGTLTLYGGRILGQTTTNRMGDPVSGYSITRVYTGQGFRVENTSVAVSNDVVTVPISFAADSSITWGNQVAASIDPSIAPAVQIRVFVYARNSWTGPLVPAWINIDNDGSIRINSDAAIVWFGHATYVRKPAGWTAS